MRKITPLLLVVFLFVIGCANNQTQKPDDGSVNQDPNDEKMDGEKKEIVASFLDLQNKYKSLISYVAQAHTVVEYNLAEREFQQLSDRIDKYNAALSVLYGSRISRDKILGFPHKFKNSVFDDPKYFNEVYDHVANNMKKEQIYQKSLYSNNNNSNNGNSGSGSSNSSEAKTCAWCGKSFSGQSWTVSMGEPVQWKYSAGSCSPKCAMDKYNSQRH